MRRQISEQHYFYLPIGYYQMKKTLKGVTHESETLINETQLFL